MAIGRGDRAWVEVDRSALTRNFERIRERVGPDVRILPMVKADAYGLGVLEVVRTLEELSPWGYGVATVSEGLELRESGIRRPVLVLLPVDPEELPAGLAAGLTFGLSSRIAALALAAEAMRKPELGARMHLELDTGMGRAGFAPGELLALMAELQGVPRGPTLVEGVYTHLHSADLAGNAGWETQRDALEEFRRDLPARWWGGLLHHWANSAGIFRSSSGWGSLVRPGIFLFGGGAGDGLPTPEPVAALRARTVLVREVPAGTTLGYGSSYRASRRERWATLSVGYGDGLPRSLGNRGEVLLRGGRVPIVGRISMDLTVVDVTGVPGEEVRVGEVVTFFGSDMRGGVLGLDEVAGRAGTISYEILTGLGARLPRRWAGVGAASARD